MQAEYFFLFCVQIVLGRSAPRTLLAQVLSSGLSHSAIEVPGLVTHTRMHACTERGPVILTVVVCSCSSNCPELSLVEKKTPSSFMTGETMLFWRSPLLGTLCFWTPSGSAQSDSGHRQSLAVACVFVTLSCRTGHSGMAFVWNCARSLNPFCFSLEHPHYLTPLSSKQPSALEVLHMPISPGAQD